MREGKIKNGKAWAGTQRYYSIISFGKHRVDILGTMLGGFLSVFMSTQLEYVVHMAGTKSFTRLECNTCDYPRSVVHMPVSGTCYNWQN